MNDPHVWLHALVSYAAWKIGCWYGRREFARLQREVGEWAQQTFPDATHATICAHLAEEVGELREAVYHDRPDEQADVLLILLHSAHRERTDLLGAARAKFARCKRWTWAKDEERGYVRHVK